jgi:hypothetical protein
MVATRIRLVGYDHLAHEGLDTVRHRLRPLGYEYRQLELPPKPMM